MEKVHVETLWLSDLHLGNRDCKAEYLLDFLQHHHARTLILVGDIVDLWSLKSRHHWPKSHNRVVTTLLDMAHNGTRVIYVPGNHDEAIREFVKFDFGKVEVRSHYTHQLVNGQKALAIHGDEFDTLVCHSRLTSVVGDIGYDFLLFLNRWNDKIRKLTGQPYWSLSGYIKEKVHKAKEAMQRFREASLAKARKRQVDAIVCGHIHHPEILETEDVIYMNDGDWIENCSSLVEYSDGTIQLVRWTEGLTVLEETTRFARSASVLREASYQEAG